MNKSTDWPEFYPESLKPVSWCIDGEVAGVNNYWNKYLDQSSRGSRKFVKILLSDILYINGYPVEVSNGFVEWFIKRFTFCMLYDENEFRISYKKDKNKKPIFTKEDYYNIAKKELGIDKKEATKLLKYLFDNMKLYYNKCE